MEYLVEAARSRSAEITSNSVAVDFGVIGAVFVVFRSARRLAAVASLAEGGARYACSALQVLHFTRAILSAFIAMMVCETTSPTPSILHFEHFASTSSPALYEVRLSAMV